MYDPKGNARQKAIETVLFQEAKPPENLRAIVHRYLELKTEEELPADYRFHALPDACTYIVFDQMQPQISGVTKLKASSEELNLGRAFHFINIRFLPGVWQVERQFVNYGLVNSAYTGDLPLIDVNLKLIKAGFAAKQVILSKLVEELIDRGLVVANPITEKVFQNIDDIHTVANMAEVANLSTRQLQRTLKRTTGFTPHDFLKVLRLQQSLNGEPSLSYADQSHFIHSFRRATGYTPARYSKKFDV